MRAALFLPLLVFGLAGCSNNNSSSVGVGVGASTGSGGYYGVHYGSYPWWYDDYFVYWGSYYPWCCDNPEDFDELINKWWNGLDEQRQQEIKEKYQNWNAGNGQADVSALRGDLATHWNAMTPEQKQTLRNNQQNRPSISNPERSPRLPLDDKSVTPVSRENRPQPLSPFSRDNPNVQEKPHLPGALAKPNRPNVQPRINHIRRPPAMRRR